MRTNNAPDILIRPSEAVTFSKPKKSERDELLVDVEKFLASGGQIRSFSHGATGNKKEIKQESNERRSKAAKRAQRVISQSSRIGGGAAAKILGITTDEMREMSERGEGPKFEVSERGQRRFYYQISDVESYKQSRGAA